MAKEKSLKSGNKFGVRYGRSNRDKFAKVENEQRKLHKCPYCHMIKVKRIAFGIWACRKCKAEFTGKAYSIGSDQIIIE